MLYLFGDTHGYWEMNKVVNFCDQNPVKKSDHILILGDAGICWDGGSNDAYTLHLLDDVPCQVLFIDGNHENFSLLNKIPLSEMYGGRVQLIENQDHIIHLIRGEIYEIEGHTVFCMGGGYSIDKDLRVEGQSWWPEEMPSDEDYRNGYINLKAHNDTVDYIFTHTCPSSIARLLVHNVLSGEEELQNHLEEYAINISFKDWYFGHWHTDRDLGRFHALYNNVKGIGP